ncbi:MAG TPA: D-aminoacylase [Pyrinomonadaceae bacterium]|nr:D-aminoacylase [Pyrinomonadaceae bacterium]
MKRLSALVCMAALFSAVSIGQVPVKEFDLAIINGLVYDGSGKRPVRADIGIKGDRIIRVGKIAPGRAAEVINAKGLAVAPGFINMLSWATESMIVDGRSLGDLKQGVTTQIFGEGWSMGPLNERLKKQMKDDQADLKFDIAWTTLSEYLLHLERRGVSQNVASYVGATTIRMYVLGEADVQPTPEQMQQMRDLVEKEMRAGALGIGSSLIYAPAFYAKTEELIELCKVAARYKGKYISHMRSEGNQFEEAVDELIRIAREANIPAEIYHLKAAGKDNWHKMDKVIAKVEAARKSGLKITANMYTYTAGATGLEASLPPWALDGGYSELFKRINDAETRKKLLAEMRTPTDKWESLYQAAGSPDKLILVGFKNEKLKPLTGKTLGEVAKMRGTDPENTILDLMVEDQSRVGTVYFLMDEENIKKQIRLPWVSFGSDGESAAPEGVFLKSNPHPRAYGNFARLLGKYVREEKVITLEEAIRRLTSLPAGNLGLDRRGLLKSGYFADVVIFDQNTIADKATFEKPHQFAVGVRDVFVNGMQMLKEGEHTGKFSGRALWGPGKVN